MRTFLLILTISAPIGFLAVSASAELGSDNPTDAQLLAERLTEAGSSGSGIFDIQVPGTGQVYQPAGRVTRDKFGVVGPFTLSGGLQLQDLDNLVFPGTSAADKAKLFEGMKFFTMFHTPGEGGAPNLNGVGPINNQPACIGCHLNAAEALKSKGLLQGQGCATPGVNCTNVSNVTRAARSTLTNFEVTSLNKTTGGGNAPDNLDALFNTGKTAAFTTFGNFTTSLQDTAAGSIGFFDPLDGLTHPVSGTTSPWSSQPFGGFVQHVRPLGPDCVAKPLPPLSFDTVLNGKNDGSNAFEFRRSVGERAGPPYIGRGLMEAVPTNDILFFNANQTAENGTSSLGVDKNLQCAGGCISGVINMINRTFANHTSPTDPQFGTETGAVGGVGRFGLRANGVEILQFAVGGLQGELSFTSLFNGAEINFPTLFRGGKADIEPKECAAALSQTFGQGQVVGQPSPVLPPSVKVAAVDTSAVEVHLSEPFSERNFIRNTAPPEFGKDLLKVLNADDPAKPLKGNSKAATVQRGAQLFGIDLVAFANRTVGGAMTAGGDGRDDNAINQADRKLNCVGCHTPIRRTGQSPTSLTASGVGSANLSFKWAPLFSDQLLHHMPVISGERATTNGLPRDVVVIARSTSTKPAHKPDNDDDQGNDDEGNGKGNNKSIFDTLDLPRNLADDTFSNAKATAEGSEFRTAPLMGLGRIGPPLLHDARVYLSKDTVDTTPAGTVTTNSDQTNAPLVVRSVDDAILAAIELHDLPAPDDKHTPKTPGAGCPVPEEKTNVTETAADICPAYSSATSQTNRSDSREVIYRFRQLNPDDQQALIEFLKQL